MKKMFIALVMTVLPIFAEEEGQETVVQATNWKDTLLNHWQNLSHTHKMIAYGLLVLVAVLIVCRLVKCGFGGCGCGCTGKCTCHK